jgi:hypothetical protein
VSARPSRNINRRKLALRISNYLSQRDLLAIALLSGASDLDPQADQATQRAPKLALGSDPHGCCLAGHPCASTPRVCWTGRGVIGRARDWLGDMPEHWQIKRNGRLFTQRNETGFPNLPILEVSLRTGIRIRDFEASTRKQVMTDRGKYKRAIAGDIAYNMMRMWQGAVDIVPVDGLVSPAYIVASPLMGTNGRYFGNLFRTSAYMKEVDKYSRGIVKDRNRLYWEDFKQMPSPCPPEAEQAEIAQSIQQQTQGANNAIDRIRDVIADIYEYRTRLVADIVTGKLDVRAAAAALPEPAEESEVIEAREADDDELDYASEDEVEEEEEAA